VLGVVGIGAPTAFDSTLAAATATYWEQEASPGRKERARRRLAAIPPDSLRRLASGPLMIATYVANGPRYWADSSYDASWLWKGMTPNTTLIGQLFDFTRPYRLPAASSTSSHRRRFGKDDRRPSGS
jgi:proline iminopeptidase